MQVDVLVHQRELWRPSSTSHLITRTLAGARQHLWLYDRPVGLDEVAMPGCELWVLHPHGRPLEPGIRRPENLQVVLLDGAWREATSMAREVASWGRTVSLPMTGESRYWLRSQQAGARFSTVEALAFFLRTLGLAEPAAALELQLELHVYAGLRSRGNTQAARVFLETSPLMRLLPEIVAQLEAPRPR